MAPRQPQSSFTILINDSATIIVLWLDWNWSPIVVVVYPIVLSTGEAKEDVERAVQEDISAESMHQLMPSPIFKLPRGGFSPGQKTAAPFREENIVSLSIELNSGG